MIKCENSVKKACAILRINRQISGISIEEMSEFTGIAIGRIKEIEFSRTKSIRKEEMDAFKSVLKESPYLNDWGGEEIFLPE